AALREHVLPVVPVADGVAAFLDIVAARQQDADGAVSAAIPVARHFLQALARQPAVPRQLEVVVVVLGADLIQRAGRGRLVLRRPAGLSVMARHMARMPPSPYTNRPPGHLLARFPQSRAPWRRRRVGLKS